MRDRNAPLKGDGIDTLAWEKMGGLIPALVQDANTLQVLMLGYMDREALAASLTSGYATFYSRSKRRLWRKGESSGNRMEIRAVFPDCDGDALLVVVRPEGPACHLDTASCFSASEAPGIGWLPKLARIVAGRAGGGPQSYTARLLDEGPMRIAQKVGEEAVELALAGAAGTNQQCVAETADLVYHLTVLMAARGFGWDDIANELRARHS